MNRAITKLTRWPVTIKVRLTSWFVLILLLILSLFSSVIFKNFATTLEREFDSALFNYSLDLQGALDFPYTDAEKFREEILLEEKKVLPFSLGKVLVQVQTKSGRILLKSGALAAFRFKNRIVTEPTFEDIKLPLTNRPSENYRLLTMPMQSGFETMFLQVAAPLDTVARQEFKLKRFFFIFVPIVAILSAFSGYWLITKALNPIKTIIRESREIQAVGSDLSLKKRLAIPSIKDEIFSLVTTLNQLLDRIEQSVRSQDDFVANAAHQLKTPLAVIRGELEVFQTRSRTETETIALHTSLTQEIERLYLIIENLLLLSHISADPGSLLQNQPLRLDEIVIEQVSRLTAFAKTRSVKCNLNIDPELKAEELTIARGDPELFGALVFNLVENAIKYTAENSAVEVEITKNQNLEIRITDHGPGIPDDEKPRVFERFYRGTKTRGSQPGSGIGLSLAKKIADLHQMGLEFQTELGRGSTFVIKIS